MCIISQDNNYMKCQGSYHLLIFGSIIDDDEYKNVKETELFKKYALPMYGNPYGGEKFIGFEYGRIYGLYDKVHYTYGDTLSFTSATVPDNIKSLFEETYPTLKGTCHAIIQNVYTSHYTSGSIMYGYWINQINNEDKILDIVYGAEMETYGYDIQIKEIGHNMSNSVQFFIGVNIKEFVANEGDRDHEKLAEQLTKAYSTTNSKLPERDVILRILRNIDPQINLSQLPMLCLLQNMCYCCT